MNKKEPEEQPQQVSRIDKLVARQKKPWVKDVDYGVLKEDTRFLGDCSGCETRHMLSHVDKARRYYCGNCIDKLSGNVEVKKAIIKAVDNANIHPNSNTKPLEPIQMYQSDPISNQIDLTVIIAGKVYDLVVRDEVCDHSEQRFIDQMKQKKSNFCKDCGKIMNYRKPKEIKKKTERKEKKDAKARTNK